MEVSSPTLPVAVAPDLGDTRARVRQQLREADSFDLSVVLGLVTLLLYGDSHWYVRVPCTALALAALALSTLRTSRTMWATLAGALLASDAINWHRNDNHKFLMAYYCVAAFVALFSVRRAEILAGSARLLIGLCFACAVLWKLGCADYVDGRFFRQALLLDERFRSLATSIARLHADDFAHNDKLLGDLTHWGMIVPSIELRGVDRVGWIADLMTWWTVIIEGLIATAFLLPQRYALSQQRDWILLLFIASTYSLASVLGFASILLALGIAQAPRTEARRLAYFGTFLLLQIYTIPWREVIGL